MVFGDGEEYSMWFGVHSICPFILFQSNGFNPTVSIHWFQSVGEDGGMEGQHQSDTVFAFALFFHFYIIKQLVFSVGVLLCALCFCL